MDTARRQRGKLYELSASPSTDVCADFWVWTSGTTLHSLQSFLHPPGFREISESWLRKVQVSRAHSIAGLRRKRSQMCEDWALHGGSIIGNCFINYRILFHFTYRKLSNFRKTWRLRNCHIRPIHRWNGLEELFQIMSLVCSAFDTIAHTIVGTITVTLTAPIVSSITRLFVDKWWYLDGTFYHW